MKSPSREAYLQSWLAIASMIHQPSGVRETRVRGGAAIWPNLRGRGGVRRRLGKLSRGARWARGARLDLPDIDAWAMATGGSAEEKRILVVIT